MASSNSYRKRYLLRAKRLGILMRDARLAAGRTIKETAEALRISPSTLRAYEEGRKVPSLPELAALAYYLQVPLDHFWSREILSDDVPLIFRLPLEELLQTHHQRIAERLRTVREEQGLSLRELAQRVHIPVARLRAYEAGERPIPVVELEALADALGLRLQDFIDAPPPIGDWLREQEQIRGFLELPPELREFVSKPTHVPYLEVARKLSQLPVERLRTLAEALLDITF
ncbi:MAG: helix-turn-helix transcriptional regulator [Chloroflexi bacterium]|nr:helix-turn-helix transcriptional regulator [Chloroflexota bacterium]